MPKDTTARRQRPVSCQFCRTRKLRCSRTQPCTNCQSRGIECRLEDAVTPAPPTSAASADHLQVDILERLRRLERLFAQQAATTTGTPMTADAQNQLVTPSPSYSSSTVPAHPQQLDEDVAYLERVSRGWNLQVQDAPSNSTIRFKVGARQSIIHAEEPKCIWLPSYDETKPFLERYIAHVNYVHHVVHVPSLHETVDGVYTRLNEGQLPDPNHVMLLLSILASTAYMWTQDGSEPALFASIAEATKETDFWVQTTLDVLSEVQRSNPSLEAVQAIIILSFVIGNLWGVSLRYRSLHSTAVAICRELGLHRIDHPSNARTANTVKAEIGRRAWWYLVAIDWVMAARFSGDAEGIYICHPRQMAVRPPRNINDEDILEDLNQGEQPISQPTDMSYCLQRIRLGELCRSIVDRSPVSSTVSMAHGYANVMTFDAELDEFMDGIPSYFRMDDNTIAQSLTASLHHSPSLVFQAYMLNSHIHIQKLKLHLPYFTSHSQHPMYTYSKETCLKAARRIVRLEERIERANHPLAVTRLKFTGSLYGLFMASVVLLMDLCMNSSSTQTDLHRGEVAGAFRILESATSFSPAADNLLQALMQILRKHGILPSESANNTRHEEVNEQRTGPISTTNSTSQPCSLNGPTTIPTDKPVLLGAENDASNLAPNFDDTYGQLSYFDELTQSLDGRTDIDPYLWNEILFGLNSSVF